MIIPGFKNTQSSISLNIFLLKQTIVCLCYLAPVSAGSMSRNLFSFLLFDDQLFMLSRFYCFSLQPNTCIIVKRIFKKRLNKNLFDPNPSHWIIYAGWYEYQKKEISGTCLWFVDSISYSLESHYLVPGFCLNFIRITQINAELSWLNRSQTTCGAEFFSRQLNFEIKIELKRIASSGATNLL